MENKKEGRKVRYTKMVLKESLIELIREKPIAHISIKEICAVADIGRTTFYAHYRDQYDLLQQIQEQTFIEADKVFDRHRSKMKRLDRQEIAAMVQDILQFIIDNSNSIQVLLSENGDRAFQKKFFRKSIERIRQYVKDAEITYSDEKAFEYRFIFVAGGMIALIQEWLKNGMDTPAPDIAKMIARLTIEGFL
jgi:AcrR family transcriptional regulator